MTNEQAKQEAIKKIISDYYDKYPKVKPYRDLQYYQIL